jgi:hypothetical protein
LVVVVSSQPASSSVGPEQVLGVLLDDAVEEELLSLGAEVELDELDPLEPLDPLAWATLTVVIAGAA